VAALDGRKLRLRERLLVFLGVCLPLPVLAATGLSIPLPGTVERMAAELVPFADTATLADATRQVQGSIVLTDAERQRVPVARRPEARPTARVRAQAAPKHPEQSRRVVAGRRSPALPATEETGAGRTGSRPRPDVGPPPPPAPPAPAEHPPGLGSEKPKPPHEPPPNPDHKPKPKKPKEPKDPKDPKEPKEPKPKPEPPPEPETSVDEDGATLEEDKGSRSGKPGRTVPPSSSAHGS